MVKYSFSNRLRHLSRALPKEIVGDVLKDVEKLTVATYEGLLGDDLQFDEILSRRVILPNRLGGIAMGSSPCADAAYVAASAKMEGFVVTSDLFSAALALLAEHIEGRENSGSYRAPGFFEEALREACDVVNAAAASNSTLIDKDPERKEDDEGNVIAAPSPVDNSGAVWTAPAPLAPFAHLYQAPLSQKELSEPLWNSFYNSTVLMARGVTDQTTRDLHLTLLDEGSTNFGSGVVSCAIPSSPFTRFSSPEFVTVLRNLLGLSAAGRLAANAVHVHYCGKDRNKPMPLKNCPARDGVAALADSAAHLAHCGLDGQTHHRHNALEVSLLEMLKAAKYGWGWRREITLFSEGGEGDNVSKRWRSDIVGFRPEDGKMCVIDVNVITLAAASYRGARRTLRSRCLRTLDEAVKAKLKLPHAAARAKDLGAKHIIFALSSNGAFSRQARKFFNDVKRHVQDQGRTHMGISFRDSYGSSSFTTRYWGNFWQQRLSCALTGTSASRVLRMIATDRMQAARIATGGKDAHVVPRVYGRVGYDVPVAQSATFRLKPYDTASDDDDASVVDEANAYAEGSVFRSQAGAGSTVDDPGGGIDDPGGGDIDDLGSLDNLATSTTTSSKTSVSFVSSSLTTGFSLMSLSDKSAVDGASLGGRRWYMDDCATGSFCSSCAIPPRVAGGLWSDGVGCDTCCYPFGVLCRGCG